MTRWHLAALLAATACGRREPAPPPTLPPVDREGAPHTEVDEGSSARLEVTPARVPVGGSVRVAYHRPGPNGCYRQSDVETTIDGRTITHAYRTWFEGDICTQALVPGGFEATVTLPEEGTWQGRIVVDGDRVATYEVEAAPS